MNKINYGILCENTIERLKKEGRRAGLLLHACCAPCSSYVLEYLSGVFDITVYFYNPNIDDEKEYRRRADEERRLIESMKLENRVMYAEGEYDVKEYLSAVQGFEDCPEGGARCVKCFEMRLEGTAKYAYENGFEFFTTSLSISPMKDSALLNTIGELAARRYGVEYLYSDFKKKNGYKRSVELSKIYGLYRQDFCGCSFSRKEREESKKSE